MKHPIKYFLSILLCLVTLSAKATDLLDIYRQAVLNDPDLQNAKWTRLANREGLPQSIAALLPNASATANSTGNRETILSSPATISPSTGQPISALGTYNFNSNGYTITLSQPLINGAAWMQVRSASATAKQADATYGAATQSLIVAVAQAYFNVLSAKDNLALAQAERDADAKQLYQIRERYKVGLDAITNVYNIEASYDKDLANVIAAQNQVNNTMEALMQLTGQRYDSIEGLKITVPLNAPVPLDVEQWVQSATKNNLNVLATHFAVEALREQIKVNFAGHFPTLSAVGTYARSNGENLGFVNERVATAGLQLNVPIFQGGLISSQTRQAQDQFAAESATYENVYRGAIITTRQQFNSVMSGINQLKADNTAIASAQSSLDSTEESFRAGTRTIVDVLLTRKTLFLVKQDYSNDLYSYLLSTLQLKQAAGTLCPRDLAEINLWLHGR